MRKPKLPMIKSLINRRSCARGSIKKLNNGVTVCCPRGAYTKSGKVAVCTVGFTTVKHK